MSRQRDSAHAALWSSRPWNQPVGRVAWWIRQAQRSGSHLSRQAARLFWLMLVDDVGLTDATCQLADQGIAELPAWLGAEDSHAPIPEAPEQMTFFASLEMETRT